RGRAVIDERADLAEPLLDVRVARLAVARPTVRIRAHLFAFARELPLARDAQARAVGFADFLRAGPRRLVDRKIGALLGALAIVDAEAFVHALALALRGLRVPLAAEVL